MYLSVYLPNFRGLPWKMEEKWAFEIVIALFWEKAFEVAAHHGFRCKFQNESGSGFLGIYLEFLQSVKTRYHRLLLK